MIWATLRPFNFEIVFWPLGATLGDNAKRAASLFSPEPSPSPPSHGTLYFRNSPHIARIRWHSDQKWPWPLDHRLSYCKVWPQSPMSRIRRKNTSYRHTAKYHLIPFFGRGFDIFVGNWIRMGNAALIERTHFAEQLKKTRQYFRPHFGQCNFTIELGHSQDYLRPTGVRVSNASVSTKDPLTSWVSTPLNFTGSVICCLTEKLSLLKIVYYPVWTGNLPRRSHRKKDCPDPDSHRGAWRGTPVTNAV